jgi:hypothetical protein
MLALEESVSDSYVISLYEARKKQVGFGFSIGRM